MRKYLLPQSGNFYKANLHCHTNISDGKFSPEEVKAMYMEKGYSIIAYTDHNLFVPHNELTDEKFLALNGFEMDINEEKTEMKPGFADIRTCHLCFIALDQSIEIQPCWHRTKHVWGNMIENRKLVKFDENEPDYIRVYSTEGINDAIKRLKEKNFFVTYNHPKWSLEDYSEYMSYNGMDAMEIFNTGSVVSGFDEYNPEVYDNMLRGGKRLYCIAADDNHEIIDAFGGYVVIKAERLEYDKIAEALKNGNFYSSSGPEIYNLYFEDNKIYVKCSPAQRISLVTGRRSARSVASDSSDEPVSEAVFEVLPEDKYIRITITDQYGRKANSNAYFTDELF